MDPRPSRRADLLNFMLEQYVPQVSMDPRPSRRADWWVAVDYSLNNESQWILGRVVALTRSMRRRSSAACVSMDPRPSRRADTAAGGMVAKTGTGLNGSSAESSR